MRLEGRLVYYHFEQFMTVIVSVTLMQKRALLLWKPKMAQKVPVAVVVLASIVAGFYLISSMMLLSSIIAWLSLDFSSAVLPSALAFVIGFLSLVGSFLAILMVGISHLRRILGFVFLALTIITLLACIGLLTPYAIDFQTFCNDCSRLYTEHTIQCVENCNDECCFTDMSMPLVLIFITFSAVSLLTSIVGIGVAVAHLFFTRRSDDLKKHWVHTHTHYFEVFMCPNTCMQLSAYSTVNFYRFIIVQTHSIYLNTGSFILHHHTTTVNHVIWLYSCSNKRKIYVNKHKININVMWRYSKVRV